MNKSKITRRIAEILPAAISWFIILLPFFGGIFFAKQTIYFVLLINIYALYKSLTFNYFFFVSYSRIMYWSNINWMQRLGQLNNIEKYKKNLRNLLKQVNESSTDEMYYKSQDIVKVKIPKLIYKPVLNFKKRNTKSNLKKEISVLSKQSIDPNYHYDYKKIKHIVIIPFWKEGYSVLQETLDYIKNQSFPTKQITIVLGAEKRHPPAFEMANKLRDEYKEHFFDIWVSNHELKGNEIVGKAANVNACGMLAYQNVQELGWNIEDVILSSCDCDSLFNKDYFAAMTYEFLLSKNRHQNIFVAPMQFTANYDRLYPFTRVISVINSLANISKASREHHFMPVSTYSASLKLYKDIGFWAVDVIPEDFHTFFKVLFKFGDKVRAIPIYLPTLADTAEGTTPWSAFVNQYEQEKRWAWGASDHFWMFKQLFRSFSLYKALRVFNVLHTHYTWGFMAFILYLGANIPPLINSDFYYTVEGNNIRFVSMLMLRAAIVPFILAIILTYTFIELPYKKEGKLKLIYTLISWVTLPITSIVMKGLPGLDSQTRLMRAKYMEYRLTEKPA